MSDALRLGTCTLSVIEGDLTQQDVDAVVNAANAGLHGGSGVDGAIHRGGGPEIMAACRAIMAGRGRPLDSGEAVMTTAGQLRARAVIHTVGPIFDASEDPDADLARAYSTSLGLARAEGFRSVAFPAISTGVYGFPMDRAARIGLRTLHDALLAEAGALEDVRVVLFGQAAHALWSEALAALGRGEGL